MSYAASPVIDDSSLHLSGGHWETFTRPSATIISLKLTTRAYTPDYGETAQEDAEIFRKDMKDLIEQWTKEVENISSFSDMVSHRNYQTILAKGNRAIPFLLNELRHRPHFWFDALQILIKANLLIDVDPVNEEDRGDLLKMAAAWIAWGEEKELI